MREEQKRKAAAAKRRRERERKRRNRRIAIAVSLILVIILASIGGTIAWLTDTTENVVNTFAPSNINITLAETTGTSYNMVPGNTIAKDPKVTVLGGSEACWLFVKVEEANDFDDFMSYEMAEGWNALPNVPGVYYREVPASNANQVFPVLADNQVEVSAEVTKVMMDGLSQTVDENGEVTESNYPTLTFTAYAIQKASFNDAAAAWTEVSK